MLKAAYVSQINDDYKILFWNADASRLQHSKTSPKIYIFE